MSQSHPNPFFNRQRITDTRYFVGRKRELEALHGAIMTRQSRSVVGERKLGKSSLISIMTDPDILRQQGLSPADFVFVYVDLEGMANIDYDEFWPEILDRMSLALPDGHDDLATMMGDLALAADVRFTQVRRLFRRLDRAGLTVVLMLDEFESLATNDAFNAGFYGELRSLAGELGVVYITTSKRSLYDLTYRHADTLSSPFFNIFSEVRLGLMPDNEARDLLHKLSTQAETPTFDAEQIETLMDLAGPHPFFLQVAGSYLCNAIADGEAPDVVLPKVIRRFMAEAEDHYRYLWAQLDSNEQSMLQRLGTLNYEERKPLLAKALVCEADDTSLSPFAQAFAEFLGRHQPTRRPRREPRDDDTGSLTGTTLGSYRVLSEVGRGGMAVVYQGYQASLDRYVAIKVMSQNLAGDETFTERFQREAAGVAQLQHQNIVQMFDFGIQADLPYMVMAFIEGETLKQRLTSEAQADRRLALGEVAQVIRGVAAALDYAHAHDIVHRDVKPANVMLRREDRLAQLTGSVPFEAVLTDFGVARMLEGVQLTGTGTTIGTPDYMSPEQARGEPAAPSSDIYALGVCLYEMLTGELPFTAETPVGMLLKHMNAEPPSVLMKAPHLPPDTEPILGRALAKHAEDRYATAGELAVALSQLAGRAT